MKLKHGLEYNAEHDRYECYWNGTRLGWLYKEAEDLLSYYCDKWLTDMPENGQLKFWIESYKNPKVKEALSLKARRW